MSRLEQQTDQTQIDHRVTVKYLLAKRHQVKTASPDHGAGTLTEESIGLDIMNDGDPHREPDIFDFFIRTEKLLPKQYTRLDANENSYWWGLYGRYIKGDAEKLSEEDMKILRVACDLYNEYVLSRQ